MVPFPAVTICHDIDFWKWTGILSSMATFDKTNIIGNTDLSLYDFKLEQHFSSTMSYFWKSKEYNNIEDLNDFEFIQKLFPNEFWNFAQLMHFILYKEKQKGTNNFKLRNYAKTIWKRFLHIKRKRFLSSTKDELEFLQNEICNGTTFPDSFNATQHCIEYEEMDCNDLTIEWCDKCKLEDGCFGTYFRKNFVPPLILVERYINQRNLINFVIMHESNQGEIIGDFDREIRWQNTSLLFAWAALNGGFKQIEDDIFERAKPKGNDTDQGLKLSSELIEKLVDSFLKPVVHGEDQKEEVLIPLCSFGQGQMKKCNLFSRSLINLSGKRCFTFNGNDSESLMKYGGRVGPEGGLNMLISFRMPKAFDRKRKSHQLILHEPGISADLQSR